MDDRSNSTYTAQHITIRILSGTTANKVKVHQQYHTLCLTHSHIHALAHSLSIIPVIAIKSILTNDANASAYAKKSIRLQST
jgi:hypothetical protein